MCKETFNLLWISIQTVTDSNAQRIKTIIKEEKRKGELKIKGKEKGLSLSFSLNPSSQSWINYCHSRKWVRETGRERGSKGGEERDLPETQPKGRNVWRIGIRCFFLKSDNVVRLLFSSLFHKHTQTHQNSLSHQKHLVNLHMRAHIPLHILSGNTHCDHRPCVLWCMNIWMIVKPRQNSAYTDIHTHHIWYSNFEEPAVNCH